MSHERLWLDQLTLGLADMSIVLEQGQKQQLVDYLGLLVKWNKAFNLTAIRDVQQMVSRQLLDSLSIEALVQGEHVLDVGTGAGLPGLPLSIVYPDKQFVLLDSNGKKTRFVQQVKMTLGLKNVTVVQSRVNEYQFEAGFDCVTTRAFANLLDIIQWTEHLLHQNGMMVAMKATVPHEQIEQLKQQGWVVDVVVLNVPNDGSQRHAIVCRHGSLTAKLEKP